jgi:large subunit ribosomal protein L15
MQLHSLSKIITKKKRRAGQGHGSGRVKTGGRGTKGQKSRNKVSLSFEGGNQPLIKRMPFTRGKGRNKAFKKKPVILNVKALNLLPKNAEVTVESLTKYKLVDTADALKYGVKILGDGELSIPLTVHVTVSKGAKEKIEKAGGTIASL